MGSCLRTRSEGPPGLLAKEPSWNYAVGFGTPLSLRKEYARFQTPYDHALAILVDT